MVLEIGGRDHLPLVGVLGTGAMMVNVVKQAQAVSGVTRVHAVLGGFHLAPYKDDYVREAVAGLKEIGVGYVVPMHCTGEPFYDMARAEMPGRVLRGQTGTRYVFAV
jgi:7,8-dihydropterin-6-yl-methyl-4-(beta-D-ribofuranosyl)aminobenzene 5'-phosphate synthase